MDSSSSSTHASLVSPFMHRNASPDGILTIHDIPSPPPASTTTQQLTNSSNLYDNTHIYPSASDTTLSSSSKPDGVFRLATLKRNLTDAVSLSSPNEHSSPLTAKNSLPATSSSTPVSHPIEDYTNLEQIIQRLPYLPPSTGIVSMLTDDTRQQQPLSSTYSSFSSFGFKSSSRPALSPLSMEELKRGELRKQFYTQLLSHTLAFREYHSRKYGLCKLFSTQLMRKRLDIEKERKLREEKDERRRMKALKENNLVAYLAMIKQKKDERINYLLAETDKYLGSLSGLLEKQKNQADKFSQNHEQPYPQRNLGPSKGLDTDKILTDEENQKNTLLIRRTIPTDDESMMVPSSTTTETNPTTPSSSSSSSSTDYYSLAHTINERVTEQPQLLKGGNLQPYQITGVEWLVSLYNNNLNGILADEMGLGKTVQTISLLAHLIEKKNNKGPFLICVPLSTLSNWANEFQRWTPSIRIIQYHGTASVRKHLAKNVLTRADYNVVLTTYEFTIRDRRYLRSIAWQYIIVDEGHRLKNANAKFTMTLGQEFTSRYRLLLTGTPLQNSLPELWSLLNFILPKIFSSVDDFEGWFSKPFATYKGGQNTNPSNDDVQVGLSPEEKLVIIARLHAILRPFLLRRVKSQVLTQLPEKVEHIIRCDLSAWQRLQYTQIQRYGTVATDNEDGTKRSAVQGLTNMIIHLRKASNHPYLFRNSYYIDDTLWRCSGKFELLDRILPKFFRTQHRVLIFSQMTALLDILGDYLQYRAYRFLRLDGSTSAADRAEYMRLFNAPDSPYFIFMLSTRAGGLGINLATADTVIIFDSDWNPTADAQAQDRAHRIGQTREVRVLRLVATSPVEEMIYTRANEKATMEAIVIDAGQFEGTTGSTENEERKQVLENMVRTELDTSRGASTNSKPIPPSKKRSRKRKTPTEDETDDQTMEDEDEMEDDTTDNDEQVQIDTVIPDDEAINEMIARSEEEFKLFQRMDVERMMNEKDEQKPWIEPGSESKRKTIPKSSTAASSSSRRKSDAYIAAHADDDSANEEDLQAMEETSGKIAQNTLARLLQDTEVPSWAQFSEQDKQELTNRLRRSIVSTANMVEISTSTTDKDNSALEMAENTTIVTSTTGGVGRSTRIRKEKINYADQLSEAQFLALVDAGIDPAQWLKEKHQKNNT